MEYDAEYGYVDRRILPCAMCGRLRRPPDEAHDIWANLYETLPDDDVLDTHVAWLCSDCEGVLRAAGFFHRFRDTVLARYPDAVLVRYWREPLNADTGPYAASWSVGLDIDDDE